MDIRGWDWRASAKGYTSDFLAMEWLTRRFDPLTAKLSTLPTDSGTNLQRRLLIADGHGSHVKASFVAYCLSRDIDLMVLPSHTSHATQPLDLTVFAPLKAAVSEEMSKWQKRHHRRISKKEFGTLLVRGRITAFSKPNIQRGFRFSGVYPFHPHACLSRLAPPSTPPPSSRPLQRTPLASIESENRDFMTAHASIITTPIRDRLNKLAKQNLDTSTELHLANRQIEAAHDLLASRRRGRGGVNVTTLGTHNMTQRETLEMIEGRERVSRARKRRNRCPTLVDDSPEPALPVRMLLDAQQQNCMHESQSRVLRI